MNLVKTVEDSNYVIWKYDNHMQENNITNSTVNINFEDNFESDNIIVANKKNFNIVYIVKFTIRFKIRRQKYLNGMLIIFLKTRLLNSQ